MNKPQILYIFSLGNPGKEYEKTRHNAGRIVCDEIIKQNLFEKLEKDLSSLPEEKKRLVDIKYFETDTFMNHSGKFIKDELRYKNFWDNLKSKIKNINQDKALTNDNKNSNNTKERSNLVIVYDDMDIPIGEVKLSFGRSSGGHNGVESVIKELGTVDFYRIRVGIGPKNNPKMQLNYYVLSKLTDEEVKLIKSSSYKVIDKVKDIIYRQ
ncbi:MAG: peptidyl-tRNA hydrolase, family [Patescibacteria group bacterium]|nr:peptidyl-tRNA hydrolase, family [Patescibacteria group bacterium]